MCNFYTTMRLSRLGCCVRNLRLRPGRTLILSEKQVELIFHELKFIARQWVADACLMCLETGMRMGELANLTWSNVRLDDNYIELFNWDRSRHVPISTALLPRLFAMRSEDPDRERVFDRDLASLTVAVNRALRIACERVGIPTVTARSLRHTFAARRISVGWSSDFLREVMGHKR